MRLWVEPPTGEGVVLCPSIRSRAGGLTEATVTGPVPVGQPLFDGGGAWAAATAVVRSDWAEPVPSAFRAITRTRRVRPASAATIR